MTEDEAKQRWCPFASSRVIQTPMSDGKIRVASYAPGSTAEPNCLGNLCAAWRWSEPETEISANVWAVGEEEPNGPEGWEPEGHTFTRDGFRERRYFRKNAARNGFCGLAGRPE